MPPAFAVEIVLTLNASPSLLEFARVLAGGGSGGSQDELLKAAVSLRSHTAALQAALATAGGKPASVPSPVSQGEFAMANPVVDQTIATMTAASSVEDSVIVFINGVPQMIKDAEARILANGATEEELAPLTQLNADLTARRDAILAAIAQNTPVSEAQFRAKK